jgi:transcriptional regulator with XRE-family HTH domain
MAGAKKRIEHDEIVRRFGDRLREVRLSRGMTQVDVAREASVSTAYVGRLERGRAAPGIDLVARLAVALGTTAAELLPEMGGADAIAVLRQQARRTFDALVKTESQAVLSLLNILLAHLAETASPGR